MTGVQTCALPICILEIGPIFFIDLFKEYFDNVLHSRSKLNKFIQIHYSIENDLKITDELMKNMDVVIPSLWYRFLTKNWSLLIEQEKQVNENLLKLSQELKKNRPENRKLAHSKKLYFEQIIKNLNYRKNKPPKFIDLEILYWAIKKNIKLLTNDQHFTEICKFLHQFHLIEDIKKLIEIIPPSFDYSFLEKISKTQALVLDTNILGDLTRDEFFDELKQKIFDLSTTSTQITFDVLKGLSLVNTTGIHSLIEIFKGVNLSARYIMDYLALWFCSQGKMDVYFLPEVVWEYYQQKNLPPEALKKKAELDQMIERKKNLLQNEKIPLYYIEDSNGIIIPTAQFSKSYQNDLKVSILEFKELQKNFLR